MRNHIYSFALTSEECIPVLNDAGSVVQPAALTQTCKQIRSESLLLFYNLNSFTPPPRIMADRTASWDAVPESGELPDGPFIDSMNKVMKWLKTMSIEYHHQNALLQLRLVTEDHWMFSGRLMDKRKDLFCELREEIRRQGYEENRVVLVHRDRLCVFGNGPDRDHMHYRTQYDTIVSYFEDVGFKKVDIDNIMDLPFS